MDGRQAPGRFIVLEGPDGAGKSSQATLLEEWLRGSGHRVTSVREPGGTSIGQKVRAILLSDMGGPRSHVTDALLFNAARSQLVREIIQPALASGSIVISDRFAPSTLAYQGYGGGVDIQWLRDVEAIATAGVGPDLVILLDVPPHTGMERRTLGDQVDVTPFEEAGANVSGFAERVRAGYLELAAAEPDRWFVVDATSAPEVVASAVRKAVDGFLAASEPSDAPARTRP